MTTNIKHLPTYSFKEEIVNSLTHLFGLIFALATLSFFIYYQLAHKSSFIYMIPFYIYSMAMMCVFFVSSFYHSSKFNTKRRAVSRIIDHCDIYVFVAATYFPICVYGIENHNAAIAIMVLEVTLMLAGIILNLIPSNHKAFKIITYIIYILDGWMLIFFFPFNIGIKFNVFLFALLGGIVYSLGAITYAIGSKRKWFHSIFHVFVVLAAMTQFVGILFLLF